MEIKRLQDCPEFIAGDNSILREIFNPEKEVIAVKYSLAFACVKPGCRTMKHRLKYSEVYFILKGQGIMHINGEKMMVNQYDTIYIPPHSNQFIENTGEEPLEFLCIVEPAWTPECEEILETNA